MNSTGRVLAAVAGDFADRRAWTATLSLYGARLRSTPPETYYRAPRLYAEGQSAVAERFGPDVIFGPFALALEGEAYGSELTWTAKAPPNVRRPVDRSLASSLAPKRPEDRPGLGYLVEALGLVAASLRGERPVAGVIAAPIDLPALILGIDAWMDILLFDQGLASGLLDLAVEHFGALARAYFAAGSSFIATPAAFANPRILNADLVERLTLPALSRAFAAAGGPVLLHHGASPMQEIVHLYKGLPGVAGFVVDERDSFEAVRSVVGAQPILLGGHTGPLMERRSVDRLRALVRAALEDRAGDPRFILASTAADVPWDTPEATLDAVRAEVVGAGGAP